jgi:hypothetical protein
MKKHPAKAENGYDAGMGEATSAGGTYRKPYTSKEL